MILITSGVHQHPQLSLACDSVPSLLNTSTRDQQLLPTTSVEPAIGDMENIAFQNDNGEIYILSVPTTSGTYVLNTNKDGEMYVVDSALPDDEQLENHESSKQNLSKCSPNVSSFVEQVHTYKSVGCEDVYNNENVSILEMSSNSLSDNPASKKNQTKIPHHTDTIFVTNKTNADQQGSVVNASINNQDTNIISKQQDSNTSSNLVTLDDRIGKYILYYCKDCMYNSPDVSAVDNHVKSSACSNVDINNVNQQTEVVSQNLLLSAASESMEHSYAGNISKAKNKHDKVSLGTDNIEPNRPIVSIVKKEIVTKPAVLLSSGQTNFTNSCTDCPFTVLYSNAEFEFHQKCHEASGQKDLFSCFMCSSSGNKKRKRGRPMGISMDWYKTRQHLSKTHDVNFKLVCNFCNVHFKSHAPFMSHLALHWNNCVYAECLYRTEHDQDLKIHEECHDSSKPKYFKCALCDFKDDKFPQDWQKIHAHLLQKHPGCITAPFVCHRCGKGLQNQMNFDQHYKDCFQAKVTCDICGKLVLATQIRHHVCEGMELASTSTSTTNARLDKDNDINNEAVHNSEKLCCVEHLLSSSFNEGSSDFRCSRHGMDFKSKAELEIHMAQEHSRSTKNKKMYNDYVIGSENDDLESTTPKTSGDMNITSGDLSQTDDFDVSSKNPNMVDTEPGEDPDFQSEHCNDNNISDDPPKRSKNLPIRGRRGRKKIANPEEAVRCCHCYKIFPTQWNLENHCAAMHNEERMKPLPCEHCGKLFRNQVQRRNHVRQVHEGIKRKTKPGNGQKKFFFCKLCKYATPDKKRLENHDLATHQGILPYSCPHCSYQTKEKSDLRRHKERHYGIKKFHCSHCSYCTNEHWIMVNHSFKMHNVQLPSKSRNTMGCDLSLKSQAKFKKQARIKKKTHVEYIQFAGTPILESNSTQPVIVEPVQTIHIGTHVSESSSDLAEIDLLTQVARQVDVVSSDSIIQEMAEQNIQIQEVIVKPDGIENGEQVVYVHEGLVGDFDGDYVCVCHD